MRLGVFRIRSLTVADVALLVVSAGLFGMFYFASLYVQEVLGYSPIKAGLAFLPVTGGIILGSGAGQALIGRFGVRGVAAAGATIGGIGLLVLTRLPVHGSYAADLLTGLVPLSIGLGLAFVPLTLMATSGIGNDDAGLASGLFNVAQQVGGSLGLAILSTLAASRSSSLIHVGTTAAGKVSATVSGYHVAFLVAAIMLFAAAAFLVFALRRSHLVQVEEEVRSAGGAVPAAA